MIELPGGHLGHVTHPGRLADEPVSALAHGGHGPRT
ncbi:hypothetical protein M2159_008619 [Streptomyces sp. SAI-090]|nr:hypothetical protein [Streptomyces sp. SAI-090]